MAKTRECKFIVSSAEEAVERVRSTLGPEARVISVKQVKGSGLQRFLASPKLEVVARLDPPAPQPAPQPAPAPSPEPSSEGQSPAEALFERETQRGGVPNAAAGQRGGAVKSRRGTAYRAAREAANVLTCGRFLEQAGLGVGLLSRLEGAADWREISALPLEQGLPKAVGWLREYRSRFEVPQPEGPVAFLGGPGAGKTTAICKLLARDVLIRGLQPQLLRLEVDKPHLDDGSLLYCEALGIPCLRRWGDIDAAQNGPVYIDIPGFGLHENAEQERVRKALERMEVAARVMVINAAYERAVVQRYCDCGDRMGARYHVYTHVDELETVDKLWERVLDRERAVLFFSDGQNLAGGRIEDCFGFLMERTFPR